MGNATGILEVFGLVSAFVACDAGCKAANVRIEVFDRNKLRTGILHACEKRPVSLDQVEKIVDSIESSLQASLDREVTSGKIGELAMDQLKNVDEVAYVRFASVYRQFKDINTFMEELTKLLREK